MKAPQTVGGSLGISLAALAVGGLAGFIIQAYRNDPLEVGTSNGIMAATAGGALLAIVSPTWRTAGATAAGLGLAGLLVLDRAYR